MVNIEHFFTIRLRDGFVSLIAVPFARRSSIVSTGIFSPPVLWPFPWRPRQAATMTIKRGEALLPFGKGAFKIIMPAREMMLVTPKFDDCILAVVY